MTKQRTVLTLVAALGVLLFWGFTMLQSCCSSTQKEVGQTDSVKIDLYIGVLPTLEALPIYYAKQAGICDSLELHIEILPYLAQFDCDTALLNNAVDICMMDRTRFAYYLGKGHKLSSQLNIDTHYALVASKDIEAKKVSDLYNHTIAISRYSGAEAFSLHTLNHAGLKREDAHYPQINDLWLRADMLTNRQIDAAVLPHLQTICAELQGHTVLKGPEALQDTKMQLVFPSNSAKKAELSKLVKAYELGKAAIAHQGMNACRDIFINDYKLPASQADSVIKKTSIVISKPVGYFAAHATQRTSPPIPKTSTSKGTRSPH